MCFSAKTPAMPKQQSAPTSDDTAAAQADTRRRLREQPSTYGSIFTSVLGDPGYGTNTRQPAGNVAVIGA
jgi:hypothetical protein